MVIFMSRQEAGEALAQKLKSIRPQLKNPIVFGIPRGGIPVGFPISDLPYFAVASFYNEFPDLSDKEVVSYFRK